MTRKSRFMIAFIALIAALSFLALVSCDSDDDDDDDDDDTADDDDDDDSGDDDDDDDDPGDPLEPTQGYLDRQAEYLQYCSDNSGPGKGGIHGQICRFAMDQEELNPDAFTSSYNKINAREDCSDFSLNSILRILYLYRDHPSMTPEILEQLENTVLGFKYWLDEPGWDDMCWWSENHQILFHTAELLAGQMYPDTVFSNSGMTGRDHVQHALPRLLRWIEIRGRIGFVEWHSNVYFNEDIPALVNLVDFAEDEDIALQAAMLLDLMAFDFANNYYKGIYATTHGRTYEGKLIGGLNDSTGEAAYIMLGLGDYTETGNFSGAALASSTKYWPPAVLEDIAAEAEDCNEARERDGIDVVNGPHYGLGYSSHEDVMFWWSMGAYAEHHVIMGTWQLVDDFNLWETWLWKNLVFLKFLVGNPLLSILTEMFDQLARGPALEAVNTYTYRTPDYQLSGAMDFNQALWGAQAHIWQATIDADAYTFTTSPGGLTGDYAAGDWTGGWFPRALFSQNVAVIQYNREYIPLLDDFMFTEYTHAYFPKYAFDEWEKDGNWTLGRKGQSYLALYSHNPAEWAVQEPESGYELISDGMQNVWICELGSQADNGDYETFKDDILQADIDYDGFTVTYESPSRGTIIAPWLGEFIVDGNTVDTGPFPRWDNSYCYHEWDTNPYVIEFGSQRMELDFDNITRKYWNNYTE